MNNKLVNPELYSFLMDRETGLYKDYRHGNELIGYVHINFDDLSEFVKIVGYHHFDEGGIEVQIFNNTVCVEINNIIESEGQALIDYIGVFPKSDYETYKDAIDKLESE